MTNLLNINHSKYFVTRVTRTENIKKEKEKKGWLAVFGSGAYIIWSLEQTSISSRNSFVIRDPLNHPIIYKNQYIELYIYIFMLFDQFQPKNGLKVQLNYSTNPSGLTQISILLCCSDYYINN